MVSIASMHWELSSAKKEKTFVKFLKDVKATIQTIEGGAFKESGTNIEMRIITIDKI
jgi:hypothetical protein